MLLMFKSKVLQIQMSNKKQLHTENSSLSTFGHSSQNSQATKKAISTQQISTQTLPSHLQSISSNQNIILPFQINIKSLIKHLLIKLEEKGVIVLFSDQNQGEILVKKKVEKNCWTSLLDCLCLCKKEGWAKGSITQSFQAVSILIKRQYIENKSKIRVRANVPKQKASIYLITFIQEIIDLIRHCLDTFKDTHQQKNHAEISEESPLAMEISANLRTHELFISNEKEDKRFKTLFNTALSKIRTQIKMLKKESSLEEKQQVRSQEKIEAKGPGIARKKGVVVYSIMQLIINETGNLFQFCRQLGFVNSPQFHPDYALYSIEGLFCYHVFTELFEVYKKDLVKQCDEFYKNSEFINKNLNTKQYFDYLEVRPKFRLQSSEQPYDLAINALRELETSLTLRQILLCMQKTFSLIKVCCLYQHDGKLDISSMDDILPVMIYVAARAQVIDFPVYVKIIDDYVKIRGVFELEERVITTLYVATEDICRKLPNVGKV